MNEDGTIEIQQELFDDVEEDVPAGTINVSESRELNNALQEVRKLSKVQRVRRNVNNAIKAYRAHEQKLMKERRKCLIKCMETFKEAHYEGFRKIKTKLNKKLLALRKIETQEVRNILGDDAQLDCSHYGPYNISTHVDNRETFGPLKHTFWTH
jgi:CCR4-NOT transcriptional regulation complex NOT5 subunit